MFPLHEGYKSLPKRAGPAAFIPARDNRRRNGKFRVVTPSRTREGPFSNLDRPRFFLCTL
jgi:hypothetical protein